MLCSVTHNSCSVASLKGRINDVSGTGATVKKSVGVCVCFVSIVFVFGGFVLGIAVFIV